MSRSLSEIVNVTVKEILISKDKEGLTEGSYYTPTPFFAFLDDKFNGVMHQF